MRDENAVENDDGELLFDSIKCQFPISKVKGICKLDPDLDQINPEAVKLIAKATEFFIEELAKSCYTQAVLDKRKTVQTKDIERVINSNPIFEFLEDALDDWIDDEVAGEANSHSQDDEETQDQGNIIEDSVAEDVGEEMEETQPLETNEQSVDEE